jgi:hypothetical protein
MASEAVQASPTWSPLKAVFYRTVTPGVAGSSPVHSANL